MQIYKQTSIFLLLVTLMASFYMLTFRGRIESGDTLRALDALTSQTRYGDWLMDESVWFKYTFSVRENIDFPLTPYDVQEKLNLQLASPLLQLAQAIPKLGNIHTVWLFNIIVTSLNIGLLYLCVRALDYSETTAIGVAISAGIATNMWAYSQTFFREPLVSFFILLAILGIQVLYNRGWIKWLISIGWILIMLSLAYLTKFSAIMAFPAIIFLAIPTLDISNHRLLRKLSTPLLLIQVMILGILLLLNPLPEVIQNLVSRFNETPEIISYALRVYILSPGGSLWGTSPILLLSLIGNVMLIRQNKHRLVWVIWLIFAGYTTGHAVTTGTDWFGGQSWPPRFLTPIIPVLMLATAPVLHHIIQHKKRLLGCVWVALVAYGIWIQFSSVSLMWYQYESALPPESGGLTEWEAGLTQVQYFRWVVIPQQWQNLGIDFLWVRANANIWFIQFGILTIILLAWLVGSIRKATSRIYYFAPLTMLVWAILVIFNLRGVYYSDPVTQSQKLTLHDISNILETEADIGDVLILPNNNYERFILNHQDSATPRTIILPPELAEPASEKQPAEIVSNNPNDWLPLSSIRVIHHLGNQRDHIWYLANTSPFMSWSFRPFERYMAMYYYPLRELELEHPDDTVRLLEYSTRNFAPNPFSTFASDNLTDLLYGDTIQLLGFQLPNGVRYEAGQAVELSLLWQSDNPVEQDHTVAWFIASAETGQFVAQGQDSMPQAGFAPTSQWQASSPIWDNRALRLPDDLLAGEYVIWILLYHYNPDTAIIERLPVTGETVTDNGTIGVLPITLVIN